MTERGRGALARDATHLAIGPSRLHWDGDALRIAIDEITVPILSRLRGEIVVRPRGINPKTYTIDTAGRHRWRPIAPSCEVSVRLASPAAHWDGTGYFDMNEGDEPLEAAFRDWTWSRFDTAEGARIFYDTTMRDGSRRSLSLAATGGRITPAPPQAYLPLPRTGWGIARTAPGEPTLLRTLENAPFYARSAIRSRIDGADVVGVHESLSLPRLVAPAVRLMLPFKMPRRST